MCTLAQPFPMVAVRTLVIEPPSPGAPAWRALLSQRKGRRGGSLPHHTLVCQEVPLEAEHIAQYAAVCGFSPAYGVPMTYPHLLGFSPQLMLTTESTFPYPVIGLVRLCNIIRQHQRLQAGKHVCVEVRLRRLFHHARGQAFAIGTTIVKAGAVVWESLSTYLRMGVPPPQGILLIALPSVQNLSLGGCWDVPVDTGRRYAGMPGDWNPVHVSDIGARLFSFAHPIIHSMWTKAHALVALLPATPLTGGEVVAEFRTSLSLPGAATLWQANEATPGCVFEVRNTMGDKPYLCGMLTLPYA